MVRALTTGAAPTGARTARGLSAADASCAT
jgi:hypothetical protein